MNILLGKVIPIVLSALITVSSMGLGNADYIQKIIKFLSNEENIIKLYSLGEDEISYDKKSDLDYVNDIILVYFASGTSDERRKEIIRTVDGEYAGEISVLDQWQIRVKENSVSGLNEICNKLEKIEDVEAASIDILAQTNLAPQYIPKDKWGNATWNSPEYAGGYNWSVECVDAVGAWDYKDYFKKEVNIGVVDVNIDNLHEDLEGRVFFSNDKKGITKDFDDGSHGTQVCSVISAIPDNTIGLTGIALNSKVYAYDWRVNAVFDTLSTIMAGFTSCVDEGKCKIVNFSIGATDSNCSSIEVAAYDKNVCATMAKLIDAGYDFLVVQSAGNGDVNGNGVDAVNNGLFCVIGESSASSAYSKRYKEFKKRVLIVGATNSSNHKVSWSNYGDKVEIYAPGQSVYMASASKFGSGSYVTSSGTSFSAPIVSAVAGLISSVNPDLNAESIKNIICDAKNSTFSVYGGYGNIVDARLCTLAAIETLPKADYTGLDEALKSVPEYEQSRYTTTTWKRYADALTAARNVDRNLLAEDQTKIDIAKTNLVNAFNGLVLLADYSELNKAIESASLLKSDDYFNFSSFSSALTAARRIATLQIPITRQGDIDSAVERLETAKKNLIKTETYFAENVNVKKGTVIDNGCYMMYGFREDMTASDVGDYITFSNGAGFYAEANSDGIIGTGSKITLTQGELKLKTYPVIIFGDVNGDGKCNGDDAIIVSLISCGKIDKSSLSSAVLQAADCNNDGKIDDKDVDLLAKSGVFAEKVNQSR